MVAHKKMKINLQSLVASIFSGQPRIQNQTNVLSLYFSKKIQMFCKKTERKVNGIFEKELVISPPPPLSPQVVLLIYTCLNLSSAIQHEFFLFSLCKNVFFNISQYEYSYYRRLNRGKFLPLLETAPYLQRAVLLHIKNFVPSMIARILESLTSLMIAIGILGEQLQVNENSRIHLVFINNPFLILAPKIVSRKSPQKII